MQKESVTGEKPILSFETRSRIVFFQSRASRRERDFVHRISSLETRSRILFTESRTSRRDREFCSPNLEIRDEIEIFRSFYQNIYLSQKKNVSHKRSNITVQLEEEGKCQSKPRLDFDHTLLNPWKAILEWRQSNCKCNISYCTFTFVQLDSIHCVLMILEVSPEAGWKWKIFTESSVINVGGNYMILIEHHVMVKVNNISRFFRDEIEIFSNLVVWDEIEICFF